MRRLNQSSSKVAPKAKFPAGRIVPGGGGGGELMGIRGGGVPYSTSNYLDLRRGTAKKNCELGTRQIQSY